MNAPLLLGPQRPRPNLPQAVAELGSGSGPIVVISAGWRGSEPDDEPFRRHIGPDIVVLPIYGWFEAVMNELPELRQQYRARQDALVALRRLHRLRLNAAMGVVEELSARSRNALEEEHLGYAVDDVRQVDQQLLDGAGRIHAAHPSASWGEHPVVAALRQRAAEMMKDARLVAIAGGHVAVLLNRLQFFGVDGLLRGRVTDGRPIIAWSAGSMVLTERVVLYYDDPPDGPAYPELLDYGLGLIPQLVMLPHARQRLRLDDRARVGALARRFAPAVCLGAENGAWLSYSDGRWFNRGEAGTSFRLLPDGDVVDLPVAP
jgi:Peptidase family S51